MKTAHRNASHAKRRYTADPMAIYRVISRVEPFTVAEQAALNLPVRLAFDAFIKRTAVEDDFHTLAGAINVSMICAEKIDPLVEQSCITGRDAVARVHERFLRTGQWGLDGPALTEIEQTVDIYEQLTSLLTGGQLKAAMTECIDRMAKLMEIKHCYWVKCLTCGCESYAVSSPAKALAAWQSDVGQRGRSNLIADLKATQ